MTNKMAGTHRFIAVKLVLKTVQPHLKRRQNGVTGQPQTDQGRWDTFINKRAETKPNPTPDRVALVSECARSSPSSAPEHQILEK